MATEAVVMGAVVARAVGARDHFATAALGSEAEPVNVKGAGAHGDANC